MNIYNTFHQSSKRTTVVPEDTEQWPEKWRKTQYKIYEGSHIHKLTKDFDKCALVESNIHEILLNRKTRRDFSKDVKIKNSELSYLLSLSCGENESIIEGTENKHRRTYASAGALFPIEIYIYLSTSVEQFPAGLYHYRPDIHALEELDTKVEKDKLTGMLMYPWALNATITVFVTGVFGRTTEKYKDRGYRFVLLEAGLVGGNISLVSEALGFSLAQIGGTHDEKIESFLDIDGVSEALISVFVIGKNS